MIGGHKLEQFKKASLSGVQLRSGEQLVVLDAQQYQQVAQERERERSIIGSRGDQPNNMVAQVVRAFRW